MNKYYLFKIAEQLRPTSKNKKAIPMHIQICCALYKLVQAANFLVLVVSFLQWEN
jgi:hypothetical protein